MAFDSTSYSLLKTVVMMIGEYEFEGIFTEHDDPEHTEQQEIEEGAKMIPFPAYSSLVFLGFVFVMSIVIMNLMVGLAVDDITEIQNNAELQKLSLNVSSTSDTKYSIDCGVLVSLWGQSWRTLIHSHQRPVSFPISISSEKCSSDIIF